MKNYLKPKTKNKVQLKLTKQQTQSLFTWALHFKVHFKTVQFLSKKTFSASIIVGHSMVVGVRRRQ